MPGWSPGSCRCWYLASMPYCMYAGMRTSAALIQTARNASAPVSNTLSRCREHAPCMSQACNGPCHACSQPAPSACMAAHVQRPTKSAPTSSAQCFEGHGQRCLGAHGLQSAVHAPALCEFLHTGRSLLCVGCIDRSSTHPTCKGQSVGQSVQSQNLRAQPCCQPPLPSVCGVWVPCSVGYTMVLQLRRWAAPQQQPHSAALPKLLTSSHGRRNACTV